MAARVCAPGRIVEGPRRDVWSEMRGKRGGDTHFVAISRNVYGQLAATSSLPTLPS